MEKYVSARYIREKLSPVRNLINIIERADSDALNEALPMEIRKEIAFAFAVIAKEMDVEIPDV